MIPDSTNPRILADNIRTLEKKIGSGGGNLPDISPADYGSYLAVDELGEWGLDTPKTGIDYSDTEIDTGLKWTDGSAIYQKTVHGTITSSGTTQALIANVDFLISCDGFFVTDNEGSAFPLCYTVNGNDIAIVKDNTGTISLFNNVSSVVGNAFYATVRYTKTNSTKKTKKSK